MSRSYEILLPGIPVSSTRGALGWCTIILIRQERQKILFDTGSFNVRPLLLEELRKRSLSPKDIDTVFISHAHFDHIVNAELFHRSELLISETEYRYALEGGHAEVQDPYVPVSVIGLLKDRFRIVSGDEYIADGVKALALPGHTPGHMGLFLEKEGVLFAGDAVKNAWEFVHDVAPPPYYSEVASVQTYKKIRSIANIVVPGHDRSFKFIDKGMVEYTENWSVEISMYGDPYQDVKIIPLP